MKTSVKVGLAVALVWIIFCLIAFLSGFSREAFSFSILLNLFLLLAAIATGLYLSKKENNFAPGLFLDDFKVSLQSGLVYTIVISGFIYVYHEFVDPSIKDSIVTERIDKFHEIYPDKEAFAKLQEKEPEWKDKNFDVFVEQQEDNIRTMISSFSVFIFHLMGLFIFGMFFSFFGTIIVRKVILRQ